MPLLLGKDAQNCEEWFLELLSLRYPDIEFFGEGRKFVARMDNNGTISVQMSRSMADWKLSQEPGFGSGDIIHTGMELNPRDPTQWRERRKNGVTTPHRIRADRGSLENAKYLLSQVREQGFEPDEECICDFEQRRSAAWAQMERGLEHIEESEFDAEVDPVLLTQEKDLWRYHDSDCPVYIQGAIDESLSE